MRDHPREGRPDLAGRAGGEDEASNRTPEPLLVSEREAARLLGVSQRHLQQLRAEGAVPHRRLGHRVLFSRDELGEWVAAGCPGGEGGGA